ncbi:DEAD/DEAH box helicase [Lacisediminihabitans changchengi]|uniref:DEAD/DEAH box helicase n=1 Tax=Lacisediminihabitans changchengi TaxID=2787634 RepID=A0A934W4Q8_9MICO|nr:DEAD/DEAH box helicase [Lacisediminihabitans changchengi]MBK4348529.1 DEAD/DEAH box helicase [Lacisediminihabitans changchengi]
MPNFDNKAASGRPTKKYNTGAPKTGSRSEGHRGFHGDAAPAKKRWTQDDRAARTGDRPASTDRRPNWEPRAERPTTGRSERPSYGDRAQRTERPAYGRTERPSYNDRPARTERPSYGDRPARTERPSYNDRPARTERPSYGDRPQRGERSSYNDRPARTERPSYGDRPARTERPSYNDRPARTERPSYGDRPQRSERPAYGDRPARAERPSYGDRPATNDRAPRTERPSYGDRPARSYDDRPARTERPSYGDRPARTERPSYGDRPARTERPSFSDRPARTERPSYGDRPARTERPARSFDDRAPRRDSDYYPAKHDTKSASFAAHEDVVLERLEAKTITADDAVGKTWKDLGIGDNMTRQLTAMGAETPFPIQAATIPDVLSGKDVLGRGKTGSGKTIAFGAPLVERLMENEGGKNRKPGRKPRALILAPTRELAMQIDRTVQPIARSVGLFTTTIVGGVPQFKQVSTLQRGVDIVIATPGRVEDLVEQGRLDLSEVMITVLDEADHMCDLGFLEPVQRILDETKKGGQKLLFSATLDKGVATLVNQYLKNPSVHEVAGEDQASSTIDHRVLLIEQRDKGRIIEELAGGEGKTLIFARTRAFAEQLADQLEDAGIPATSLHGDLNQSRRTRNLQLLTSGRVNVLVATDVAARGIHVDDISLVIQADAPDEYKTYLHRSGRTGRAGKQGTVVTLISRARRRRMDELLGRAEIKAQIEPAAPGDSVISTLAAL